MHHTQYRGIPFHQGNVHGELAVALDELLGAIQRVHQPETGPVLALGIGNTAGFFREHRNLRRQRLQARFNDLVRRHIRFRNRRLVILGFHPQVVTLVHRQNGITRFTGNLGERVQQGIKVGHFGFPIVQHWEQQASSYKLQHGDTPAVLAAPLLRAASQEDSRAPSYRTTGPQIAPYNQASGTCPQSLADKLPQIISAEPIGFSPLFSFPRVAA